MKIVEFPGDVVDSTEEVQSAIKVVQSMAVPDSGDLSLVLQPCELIVAEAETPEIVEPALILPAKNVNILPVCSNCSAYSRSRAFYILT